MTIIKNIPEFALRQVLEKSLLLQFYTQKNVRPQQANKLAFLAKFKFILVHTIYFCKFTDM